MKGSIVAILLIFILLSCGKKEEKKADPAVQTQAAQNQAGEEWEAVRGSIVKFDSFDGDRILESGQGFFIDNNLIVTT